VALEFLSPVTAAWFLKEKCLEPMFGDARQARPKPRYAELPIAPT